MKSIGIRPEVVPFVAVTAIVFGLLAGFLWPLLSILVGCALVGYFLYFFRDPERIPPREDDAVVAGADGRIVAIAEVEEGAYLRTSCVRISIFLSLFDVHVNRSPIRGTSSFLGYFPGKRLFTFREKSSELNQHNKVLILGERTRCLICQIVGPVCRRVVYWPPHDRTVDVALGERIGMMKFGSRLDMYLPKEDVVVSVKLGDMVRAGETIVARTKGGSR
jgi:phosphatidylserine decarboxylase